MRKFLKTLTLAAVAALGVVSCTENMVDDNIKPSTTEGVTLYATTPSEESSTKVDFTDNGTGISLSWSEGDFFVLYDNDGAIVDTFTTANGDGSFDSESATTTLTEGETYTAKYNEDADPSNQDGDEINNLGAACQMVATFEYGTDAIAFEHTMAIMTFKFASEERPAKLVFENGDETYTVTYSEIEPDADNLYTSHIMVNPCGDGETYRTLTFTLYDSNGTAYDIRTVETNKKYVAGYRYTASVSELGDYWSNYAATSFAGDVEYSENTTEYSIATAEQFAYLAKLVNEGTAMSDVTFTLTEDINLSGHEWVAIGWYNNDDTDDEGYQIIVDYTFKGTFDGNDKTVSGLYINSTSTSQALFGYIIDATIKNLSVAGKVTGASAGGIVGRAEYSTISNSNSSVTVTATGLAAGIVGALAYSSIVENCYNTGAVTSTDGNAGGIVAYNCGSSFFGYPTVINCYNTATVTGYGRVGGIVGSDVSGYTINCYNSGEVINNKTSSAYTGGVVGYASQSIEITNCYNVGSPSGGTYIGGGVGRIYGTTSDIVTVTNCYYLESDGLGGYGTIGSTEGTYTITNLTDYSSSEMQATDFVTELNNNASTYNSENPDATQACAWAAVSDSYPTLDFDGVPNYTETVEGLWSDYAATSFVEGEYSDGTTSYTIATAEQLAYLAQLVNAGQGMSDVTFTLTDDINLGAHEWVAIGDGFLGLFNGNFDGNNKVITGLYINQTNSDYQGLFGVNHTSCTISNLGVAGSVSGDYYVGGVVAANNGTIINCYNLGSVSDGIYIGGIAGANNGTIINCYNSGSVSVGTIAGGIAGMNSSTSTIINCYSSGSVSGSYYVGGVAGSNKNTITNCYYLSGSVSSDEDIDTTYEASKDDMQSDDFVTLLNNNASTYNSENPNATQACAWEAVASGYPVLDFDGVPSYTEPGTSDYIVFEDANFKAALVDKGFDTDGDTEISYDEASAATSMFVSSKSITSMAELEYFTNLTTLHCDNNSLTTLDVSYNTKLETLSCDNNSLETLNVSGCTGLTTLGCSNNNLTSLDVSSCPDIWESEINMDIEYVVDFMYQTSDALTLYVSQDQWNSGLNSNSLPYYYSSYGTLTVTVRN